MTHQSPKQPTTTRTGKRKEKTPSRGTDGRSGRVRTPGLSWLTRIATAFIAVLLVAILPALGTGSAAGASQADCTINVGNHHGNPQAIAAKINTWTNCGTVTLSGVYNHNGNRWSDAVITRSNVVISGQYNSNGKPLLNNSELNGLQFQIDASNVTVQGLRFVGENPQGPAIEIGTFGCEDKDGVTYNNNGVRTGTNFAEWDCDQNNPVSGASNTLIRQNSFVDWVSGTGVIRVRESKHLHNSGTVIENNVITGWGLANGQLHKGIQVGDARLEKHQSLNGGNPIHKPWHSLESKTTIRNNYIEASNGLGGYSIAVQLYNPTAVYNNCVSGGRNGISTKGDWNTIAQNTIENMTFDGALYVRDGDRNVFAYNELQNNYRNFHSMSSAYTIFYSNRFGTPTFEQGVLQGGYWGGQRSGLPGGEPSPNVAYRSTNETSYWLGVRDALFVNNHFEAGGNERTGVVADQGAGSPYWKVQNIVQSRNSGANVLENGRPGEASLTGLNELRNRPSANFWWDPIVKHHHAANHNGSYIAGNNRMALQNELLPADLRLQQSWFNRTDAGLATNHVVGFQANQVDAHMRQIAGNLCGSGGTSTPVTDPPGQTDGQLEFMRASLDGPLYVEVRKDLGQGSVNFTNCTVQDLQNANIPVPAPVPYEQFGNRQAADYSTIHGTCAPYIQMVLGSGQAATPEPVAPVVQPLAVEQVAQGGNFSVSWSPTAGATRYDVYVYRHLVDYQRTVVTPAGNGGQSINIAVEGDLTPGDYIVLVNAIVPERDGLMSAWTWADHKITVTAATPAAPLQFMRASLDGSLYVEVRKDLGQGSVNFTNCTVQDLQNANIPVPAPVPYGQFGNRQAADYSTIHGTCDPYIQMVLNS